MKRITYIFLLLLCNAGFANAQEIFSGIVVDSASFSPMPYVTVLIKGEGRGTITDDKGSFNLSATRRDTIVFSFVGYTTAEFILADWEPGLIRLSERSTILKSVTIQAKALDPYGDMFDDENARIAARHNQFYYSKAKKEKRKLAWLKEDNIQIKTYVEVVITSPDLKNELMKKYSLSEKQYYEILARFNERNSHVMYYITAGELVTLIKNYFASSIAR